MLILDRFTSLSRYKSIGTILVSISSISIIVALYASVATLRVFPYIDFILLVTPLRSLFYPIEVYYTVAS